MSKKMNLKIITPEKVLVDEQVDAVFSKAIDGEFGILSEHIPFMTVLDIGVTRYLKDNNYEFVSIVGGTFQVSDNNVIILSDAAEFGEEIDLTRAKAAKERAEARLRAAPRDLDIHRAEIALSRAIARIQAATKNKPGF
ncbi:MAG: F0F1 ATP synthase subunit epsilon [bacterium]